MTRTIGGVFSMLMFVVANAAGQTSAPATVGCELNPYPLLGKPPAVNCWTLDAAGTTRTPIAPTVYKFGEGVVHAPGSELAWVILTNFDNTPQTVTLEFIQQGDPRPVWRTYPVLAHQRLPIAIHDDDEFVGLVTFNTRVFWAGDGDAQLVMRPTIEPFTRATIPAPTVTSGKFYTPPEE